ncbi:MAG: class I SAM-dependent methyltransferase [Yoonia sp.]
MSVGFYERNADSFIAQTADVDMAALYQRFCKHLPPGASVLDAGCGSGRDSLAFSRMGYDVVAFDASPKMVAAARKLAGVPVHQMTFADLQFDQTFDGIWACASLLHVPRAQLADVLERLASCLNPAGVLYASFKYGDEEREKDGRYFNDLNELLLQEHLRSVPRLKLLEFWTSSDQRPDRQTETWLNCLLSQSE